jgi:hypothetical protein
LHRIIKNILITTNIESHKQQAKIKTLKARKKHLAHELGCKDNALAEAPALLVIKKSDLTGGARTNGQVE